MKAIKTISAILGAAALLVACENAGYLDRSPYSSTSPENYYKDESQMQMALVACYEVINTHKIPGLSYCQYGTYGQGLIYLMNGPSDDIVGNASSMGEGVEMEQCTFDESSKCVRYFWKAYYAGINRCNTLLHYIDGIEGLTDAEKTQYKAEARFLRAFYYYHLAWNFGGIPIVKDFASSGEEPRSPLKDVYGLILEDLDFAYENLSTTTGIVNKISATKYTAAAYIGRICNYLAACKRYGTGSSFVAMQPLNSFEFVDADAMSVKAKTALEDVCLNSPYQLNPDFRMNFLECDKDAQYTECLLLAEQPLSGVEGYWPNCFYLPIPAVTTVFPGSYGGRHVPTYRGFYMFSSKDSRRDWTFTGRMGDGYEEFTTESGYTYGIPTKRDSVKIKRVDINGDPVIDPVTEKQIVDTLPHPLYDSPTQTYLPCSNMQICTGKIRLARTDQVQHTYQQHAFSYPLMRLADVYLMYAEALYFTGSETDGREWMNKVLRRAATDEANYEELLAAYHRDDFIEELLESRERELFMECSRKYDLIRFNRIDEAIMSLDPTRIQGYNSGDPLAEKYLDLDETNTIRILIQTVQQNWFPYKIWLPISEEQIGVNRNLYQNYGWGTNTGV